MRPKSMKDVKSTSETSLREDGPAATRRVRGLRDVMSTRKVAGRSVPATRSQQLSEIAWLDRELERLRRESTIMEANLTRINARIGEVVDRRDTVIAVVRKDLGLEEPGHAAAPRGVAVTEKEEEAGESESFSLEY